MTDHVPTPAPGERQPTPAPTVSDARLAEIRALPAVLDKWRDDLRYYHDDTTIAGFSRWCSDTLPPLLTDTAGLLRELQERRAIANIAPSGISDSGEDLDVDVAINSIRDGSRMFFRGKVHDPADLLKGLIGALGQTAFSALAQPHDRERADRIERAMRVAVARCPECGGQGQVRRFATPMPSAEPIPEPCSVCAEARAALAVKPTPRVGPPGVVEALRALLASVRREALPAGADAPGYEANCTCENCGYLSGRRRYPKRKCLWEQADDALAAHDARPVDPVDPVQAVLAEVAAEVPEALSDYRTGALRLPGGNRAERVSNAAHGVARIIEQDRLDREKGTTNNDATPMPEGWGWPSGSRKSHYFNGINSLCRNRVFAGELTRHNPRETMRRNGHCAECWKRLQKRLAAQQPAQPSSASRRDGPPAPPQLREEAQGE